MKMEYGIFGITLTMMWRMDEVVEVTLIFGSPAAPLDGLKLGLVVQYRSAAFFVIMNKNTKTQHKHNSSFFFFPL